jgi:hypothetical protein
MLPSCNTSPVPEVLLCLWYIVAVPVCLCGICVQSCALAVLYLQVWVQLARACICPSALVSGQG